MNIIRDKIEDMSKEKHVELLGKLISVGDFKCDENMNGSFVNLSLCSPEHMSMIELFIQENENPSNLLYKPFI